MIRPDAIRRGDRRAIARLIRAVEDGEPEARETCRVLFAEFGHAVTIGITGSPGAGKSTLINQMISLFRGRDLTVAVLACDPTSPLSGGAFLGDRLRMRSHALDAGTFIHSIATRGRLGGTSSHAFEALLVLDAAGFDVVLVETVGTGQVDDAVTRIVDTTVLVTTPDAGDQVQMLKSGLQEVADLVVLNKADSASAERVAIELKFCLRMSPAGRSGPGVPVISTVATTGLGVEEVIEAVDAHRGLLQTTPEGKLRSRARWRALLIDLVESEIQSKIERKWASALDEALSRIENRQSDPISEAIAMSNTLCDPEFDA